MGVVFVALGLLELAGEVMRAHTVCLVDDDQVPLSASELGEQIIVAAKLIHAGDQMRMLLEGGSAEHCLTELRREDLEGETELQVKLVLPLLNQAAGSNDQAPLDILAQDQLLDVEPGHDRLAGARIISMQEPKRRARSSSPYTARSW